MKDLKQETIVNFLKTYGFVFPNSEIYGGLANAWDYGPLGVLLKNNIKQVWWREFVTKSPNACGLDSAIIDNPRVYKASGHLANFSDPLIDCKECKQRFRADKLIEEFAPDANVSEASSFEVLEKTIADHHIKCPACGKENWTQIRKFNLMFKTFIGVTEEAESTVYLRPETCQPIFVDFMQIQRTTRMKLPFSVCQIGKSFRNEITPGNFIFRTREFEQMEIEYFTYPEDSMKDFDVWQAKIHSFLFDVLEMNKENLKDKEIPKDELSHYSKRTVDIYYRFPHGFSELWGQAHRGTHDLSSHTKESGKELCYVEPDGTKIVPEVVEPSVGCDRLFYAICCDKYDVENLENDETREVFRLPYVLAPYKVAVLPLATKLSEQAREIFNTIINKNISAAFDVSGSIGKRYRRQDAIGTPYCITFDFDSVEKKTVTIRDRDTMKQEVIKIEQILEYFANK